MRSVLSTSLHVFLGFSICLGLQKLFLLCYPSRLNWNSNLIIEYNTIITEKKNVSERIMYFIYVTPSNYREALPRFRERTDRIFVVFINHPV